MTHHIDLATVTLGLRAARPDGRRAIGRACVTRHSGTMAAPPDVRWRAKADGIGHAFPARGSRPALCGSANQAERFDHPVTARHDACTAALNRLTVAALRGPAARAAG